VFADAYLLEATDAHRLILHQDENTENPRLDYDVATSYIVTSAFPWNSLKPGESRKGYENNHNSLGYAYEYFADRFSEAREVFARWARIFHGWDLGVIEQDGLVWYSDPELCENIGAPMGPETTTAEISEYGKWAAGDTYGYVIERKVTEHVIVTNLAGDILRETDQEAWDEVDSCWGLIGYEYAVSEALWDFKRYQEEES